MARPFHLYLTRRWKALRGFILSRNPICEACKRAPSSHVDHRIAHKGEEALFFNAQNLQALCHSCHSEKTVKRDGGFGKERGSAPLKAVGEDGAPIDPTHPWFGGGDK